MTSLKIQNLTKKIGTVEALTSLSLEIPEGSLFCLIGANGSGKSTLLKLLSGILEPSEGQIFYKEKEVSSLQRKERSKLFSLLLQNIQSPFAYTVKELLNMSSYVNPVPLSAEKTEFFLSKLELSSLLDRPLTELSQGEKMRAFIGKALFVNSPILLLDEPFVSLDLYYQLNLWDILKTLKKEGRIIITATHDLLAAKSFSDEAIFLQKGKAIFKGNLKSEEGEKAIQKHLKITFSPENTGYVLTN